MGSPPPEAASPRWSPQGKLIVSLLLVALFVYLLYQFRVVIIPLILAVIIAYILNPLANAIERRWKIGRLGATALAFILFYLVLITLPLGFIPLLGSQFSGLNVDFQNLAASVEDAIAHEYVIGGMEIDGEAAFNQVADSLGLILEPLYARSVSLVVDFISSLVWVIFIVVVSFYFVKDAHRLRRWLEQLAPPAYRPVVLRLGREINQIWSAFFRGQLVLAVVVTVIFAAAGFALGLPFWLAMAVFAGLLEFLPSIGHGIWLVTASLLSLFIGSTWIPVPNWAFLLLIVGLHIFYQQFDLNYLIPRIIGRSVHLPPLVVILGIVTGAVAAGVLGISLAAPTIATARVFGRYIHANLFDTEPLDESVAPPLPPPNLRWWANRPPGGASRRNPAE